MEQHYQTMGVCPASPIDSYLDLPSRLGLKCPLRKGTWVCRRLRSQSQKGMLNLSTPDPPPTTSTGHYIWGETQTYTYTDTDILSICAHTAYVYTHPCVYIATHTQIHPFTYRDHHHLRAERRTTRHWATDTYTHVYIQYICLYMYLQA